MHLQITRTLHLFVPSSALLTRRVISKPSDATPLKLGWDLWGPQSTRIVEKTAPDIILSGYRVIFSDEIWDFQPRRLGLPSSEGQDDVVDWPEILPPIYERDKAITTSLPYRRIKCNSSQISRRTTLLDVIEKGTETHVSHSLDQADGVCTMSDADSCPCI